VKAAGLHKFLFNQFPGQANHIENRSAQFHFGLGQITSTPISGKMRGRNKASWVPPRLDEQRRAANGSVSGGNGKYVTDFCMTALTEAARKKSGFDPSVNVRFCHSFHGEHYRRGGFDPVKGASPKGVRKDARRRRRAMACAGETGAHP
jgi:hypothetical protein